ncbi:MAG: START domain-containing protein [Saprospiraceae bacterium]
MKVYFTLLCLLAQSLLFAQSKNTEWKLKKEVADLQVFMRNSESSDIKEIKVRFIANASLSNIVTALKDVPAFPEWIYNCAEARLLKRISETESYYYSRVAFPFPMNDRDFIGHSKLWQDEQTKEIFVKVTGNYNYLPQEKGIVRLPKLSINWHITPLTVQKSLVEYHLVSDPGGSIPDWVVNMAIDKGPINTIKNFKDMLSKTKYRTAKLHYIQELPIGNSNAVTK